MDATEAVGDWREPHNQLQKSPHWSTSGARMLAHRRNRKRAGETIENELPAKQCRLPKMINGKRRWAAYNISDDTPLSVGEVVRILQEHGIADINSQEITPIQKLAYGTVEKRWIIVFDVRSASPLNKAINKVVYSPKDHVLIGVLPRESRIALGSLILQTASVLEGNGFTTKFTTTELYVKDKDHPNLYLRLSLSLLCSEEYKKYTDKE